MCSSSEAFVTLSAGVEPFVLSGSVSEYRKLALESIKNQPHDDVVPGMGLKSFRKIWKVVKKNTRTHHPFLLDSSKCVFFLQNRIGLVYRF